jgi:hypothetical protein
MILLKITYRFARICVPIIPTMRPWQRVSNGCKEKSQRPSDNHIVKEIDIECNKYDRPSQTLRKIDYYYEKIIKKRLIEP